MVFVLNIPTSYLQLVSGQICGTTAVESQEPSEGQGDIYTDCQNPPGPFFVRVYPHIIRKTDMTGGIDPDNIERLFSELNEYFTAQNIYLIRMCDADPFIDNDDYYANIADYECELYLNYNNDDGIDIYFGDDNSPTEYYGKSEDIPGSACIVMGYFLDSHGVSSGLVGESSYFIAHEIGHCFGLLHTHAGYSAGWEPLCYSTQHAAGIPETVLNCEDAGDFCCDTPADYDNATGIGFGTNPLVCTKDLTIEASGLYLEFHGDAHNIMGYTHPHCAQYFSDCQGKRMRCSISEDHDGQHLYTFSTIVVDDDVTWSKTNYPYSIPFDHDFVITESLVIESGTTLTIPEGMTVKFGPSASLIIEPSATLLLYGTLTSAGCNLTWQGVKVYGDANNNQRYFAGYHQGFLKGFNGSIIENASTAVELWGPDEEDTGGIIVCNGTTFRNNKIGVFFLPYENIVSGQPSPYVASFSMCDFTIDDDYLFTSFDQHMLLAGVDGIRVAGCDFENVNQKIVPYNQYGFGYGLVAVNSGFKVGAASATASTSGPCLTGCSILRGTRFSGLGTGIWTGSFGENRFFSVYQSLFEDCYAGIEVDGVSGGVMLFNRFNMGTVPDPSILNGDQIGIKLNQEISAFTIEQDSFISSNTNTNNTIGISAENLGDANNVIRNNYFNGMTLANEAFGKNAGEGNQKYNGLKYLCNENISTVDKDFYVKNSEAYLINSIHPLQAYFTESSIVLAAGNIFSSTGNVTDGDFANYGSIIDEYHHYENDGVLDATSGILEDVDAPENICSNNFCAPPCLESIDISNLKGDFYNYNSAYNGSISLDSFFNAGKYKEFMGSCTKQIIQHMLVDTVSFSRDSLRAWYSNMSSLSGDILLAKDFASSGEFTSAVNVLDSLSSRFSLNNQEVDDIANIRVIFDMLEREPPTQIPQSSLDTLIGFAEFSGHSASLARGILAMHGYRFETNYELPEGIDAFKAKPTNVHKQYEGVSLYPNPNNGEIININISDFDNSDKVEFYLYTAVGVKLLNSQLTRKNTKLLLQNGYTGICVYQIVRNGELLESGKLIFME